jgi:hypothetical protein
MGEGRIKREESLELAVLALRLWSKDVYPKLGPIIKKEDCEKFFELCEVVCIPLEDAKKLWAIITGKTGIMALMW